MAPAKRSARSPRSTSATAATCHPGKPAVAKGLCSACYHRARRATPRLRAQLDAATDSAIVAAAAGGAAAELPPTLATLVATAERELAETIPEAARALRQAIQVAAAAGDARPALQFLSQFPIATPEGSRRLLEAPQSTRAANHTGVQVLVGVQLDGDGRVVRASRVIHGSGDK